METRRKGECTGRDGRDPLQCPQGRTVWVWLACKEPSPCHRGLAVPPCCQRGLSTLLGEAKHAHTAAITAFGVTPVPTDVLPRGMKQGCLGVPSLWTPPGRRHRGVHLHIHLYSPGTTRAAVGSQPEPSPACKRSALALGGFADGSGSLPVPAELSLERLHEPLFAGADLHASPWSARASR